MSHEIFRWGILGPGNIAHRFATGLSTIPDARIESVASRDKDKAAKFAEQHGAARSYGSYEELVADPAVDAVYVATLHPAHKECTMLCLAAGKPVLCEKPFTVNARDAEEAVALARSKNLFLMEGMWTRFFPLMGKVRELIASEALGQLRIVQADFGFCAGVRPESRLFNPVHAGGALLDVGVYPISLASMILGNPSAVSGMAHLGETGVDEQTGILLGHPSGAIAVLHTTVRGNSSQEAWVIGSNGRIHIHGAWWCPSKMTVSISGQADETIELPFESSGFQFEALEVMRCVREGRTESAVMPLDESLTIMRTMDTLRQQVGLKYPMEATSGS